MANERCPLKYVIHGASQDFRCLLVAWFLVPASNPNARAQAYCLFMAYAVHANQAEIMRIGTSPLMKLIALV